MKTYTDEQRDAMADKAAKLVQKTLPHAAEDSVAFALVVASRTPEGRSRFSTVTNLPMRDVARLLTRAALNMSKDGVNDVLSSPEQLLKPSAGCPLCGQSLDAPPAAPGKTN